MRKVYAFANLASLDIVAGAVCSALFFSAILDISVRSVGIAALSLTVWIIYTVDRLRDATLAQGTPSSRRHRFHHEHRKTLFLLVLLAAVLDLALVSFLKATVLYIGALVGSLVVLYLFLQRFISPLKEVFVAVLYTGGVLVPSLGLAPRWISAGEAILVVQFMLVALTNLLVLSWFDWGHDTKDGHRSFATVLGRQFTRRSAIVLTACCSLLTVLVFVFQTHPAASALLAVMAVLQVCLIIYHRQFRKFFRPIGDAIFFIPGLYWIWMSA